MISLLYLLTIHIVERGKGNTKKGFLFVNFPLLLALSWRYTKGLVTNYGEGGGGHVKFYPYEKGAQKNFWGSFYAVA